MSNYSGKCDLADHVMGSGGWYDKDGNPVNFGDKDVHVFYSDEYQDFLAFKKATGGVLHQHKKIKVNEWNQDFVAEHCNNFEIIKHTEQITDKRLKDGTRNKVSYTYKYYGKEYTLKELNKHGVYITIDIRFDTLLDLIPYYPYIVTVCCCCDGKETVYISDESFAISERDDMFEYGYDSSLWEYYVKNLQNHYKDVVLRYFNPEGREHIEELTFDENRQAKVSKPIDPNFKVEWDTNKAHWTSPKVVDYEKGIIEMSEQDYGGEYGGYLGKIMKVKYVEAKQHELWLG